MLHFMFGSMEEVSVDWRGKPCKANKHGGMSAAIFVLGLYLSLFFVFGSAFELYINVFFFFVLRSSSI